MTDRAFSQTLTECSSSVVSILSKAVDPPSDKRFDEHDSHILRICSISSSSTSIMSGIIAFYMFGAIDNKKRVFRHQLIMFLIIFDLIKLAVLLIYPAKIQTKYNSYYNHNFCEVVGFFTSLSIEGGDIAILSFAIHTGLLIFRPNSKIKNGNNNMEGGLFKYRFYVYLISFLTPCVLLSLAFINGSGYKPLTTWCYLPQEPIWYRLVLSWVPRYLIAITIVIIYVSIYYYVTKQYSIVGGNLKNMHDTNTDDTTNSVNWKTPRRAYQTFKKFTMAVLFPEIAFFYDDVVIEEEENEEEGEEEMKIQKDRDEETDAEHSTPLVRLTTNKKNMFRDKLHTESYHLFQVRRLQIQKQMKSIFIYPISYIFLWSFPFLLQCFEFHDHKSHILWLNATLAFFQSFNCTVDTLVFLYRERPWTITTLKVDTNPSKEYQYPYWRRKISWLPFYGLPTLESNQLKYFQVIQKQLEDQKLRSGSNSTESSPGDNNNNNNNNNSKHDFSNILAGSDMDFVKLPVPALRRSSTMASTSFGFNINNIGNTPPPMHDRHISEVDPMEPNSLQRIPNSRRRSSKFSWFSSSTGGAGAGETRKSSSGDSVQTFQQQKSRKKSIHSSSDNSELSTTPNASSLLFMQSYTVTNNPDDNNNNNNELNIGNNKKNLPEISEKITTNSSRNFLEAQHSPHSPQSPTNSKHNFSEGASPLHASSFFPPQQHHLPHHHSYPHTRMFSNAFGLTRRASFLENLHSRSVPNVHNDLSAEMARDGRGGVNPVVGLHDPTTADHNNNNEEGDDDDEMDFLDFLKKGPPV